MKHGGIVLATLATLVLCVLTLSVISMPRIPSAPPLGPSGQQPFRMLRDVAPEKPAAPSGEAPSTPPPAAPGSAVEGTLVTGPDGCVLLGTPRELTFLAKEGLTLMSNRSGVYAFDAASGKLMWYRYTESKSGRQNATFGQQKVLVWSGEELHLLEAATGREIWSQRNDPYGPILWALLSPEESRIIAGNEHYFMFYSINDSGRHVLPSSNRAWAWGWLPDNKTVVVAELIGEGAAATWKWRLVDFDTAATTSGWESSADRRAISMLSAQGHFAEIAKDSETDSTVWILDARTGNALREFKMPGPPTHMTWLHDAKRLLSATRDRQQTRVIDSETGAIAFSLSKEGHLFCAMRAFDGNAAQEWTFSQDESNNWYAWPLAPDGTPRMILSGRGIAPGSYYPSNPAQSYVVMDWPIENGLWMHGAFDVEHARMLAEWRVRSDASWGGFPCTVNAGMTHLVQPRLNEGPGPRGTDAENMTFSVYVRDKETPIFEGQGNVIAIAPDGKHLAAQTGAAKVSLYNIERGIVVAEYTVNNYFASFSGDSKRMAIRSPETIEVTDLTEAYPRRTMDTTKDRLGWCPILSQDGTRVLCGGSAGAWLFDADTGAMLREFMEPERFTRPYAPGPGFWNGVSRRAEDWMGAFSNKYRSSANVEVAFAEDGSRVITHALGKVIRVWEADSGKLLHTIHTGLPETRNEEGYIWNRLVITSNGRFAFSYNQDGFGIASLWSLADGTLLRQYQFPSRGRTWVQPIIADDGSAVYIGNGDNLYRWPGMSAGSPQASAGRATR